MRALLAALLALGAAPGSSGPIEIAFRPSPEAESYVLLVKPQDGPEARFPVEVVSAEGERVIGRACCFERRLAYQLALVAVNASGESDRSNVWDLAPVPAPPTIEEIRRLAAELLGKIDAFRGAP